MYSSPATYPPLGSKSCLMYSSAITDNPCIVTTYLLLGYGPWAYCLRVSYGCHKISKSTSLDCVNTQIRTYAQIPIRTQIPAYVQLPALFQPRVLSQPSTHLHHSQAPHPAMISITPMLGWDANYFHKPSNISEGSNEAAVFNLSALGILTTRSWVYWEDCFPSTVPHSILIFSTSPFLFQHPWPSPSLFYLTLGHVIFQFRLLFICGLPSIKATPFLYYTSVLISTKITTIFSLWDPHCTRPRGLTKLKDWDCLQAQHTSWSLVLLPSRSHGTFASPSEALAMSWIPHQLPVWISS